jgi:integrase
MKKARDTVKLNNKHVSDLLKNSNIGQRIYDSEVNGLHVRKLKSGGYFYLYYKNALGKARTVPIGKYADNTIGQARNKALEYMGRIVGGEDIQETKKEEKAAHSKTGRDYLDSAYRAVQARKKTGYGTLLTIENFFSDLLDKPILDLEHDDITRWQAAQEATGIKFETIKRRYSAFKTMLNHAVRKKYIEANPMLLMKLERYPETEEQKALRKARRSYLTKKQNTALIHALDQYQEEKRAQRRSSRAHGKPHLPDLDKVEFVDHVKPIMLLLLYTGFRKGDAIGLRWEDVNLNFSTISKVIEKTEHKVPHQKHFWISPPLLEVLKKWHKQTGKPSTGLVFPSPRTDGRLDETALQAPWKRIKTFAGLSGELQLYSLRHNFASHLVMKGCDLLSVAKLLGHSDIEMLVEHYGHLQPNLLKDYSNQFAEIISPENIGEQEKGKGVIPI